MTILSAVNMVPGAVIDEQVPDYRAEPMVDKESNTETYVAGRLSLIISAGQVFLFIFELEKEWMSNQQKLLFNLKTFQ